MLEQSSSFNQGGEEMGMTDIQYKGMLMDQLRVFKDILKLAVEHGDKEIQEKVEEQIADIRVKLEF